jgi:hypothetical protein
MAPFQHCQHAIHRSRIKLLSFIDIALERLVLN